MGQLRMLACQCMRAIQLARHAVLRQYLSCQCVLSPRHPPRSAAPPPLQPDASVAYPGPGLAEGKQGCCPSWKKWFWALFVLTGLATVRHECVLLQWGRGAAIPALLPLPARCQPQTPTSPHPQIGIAIWGLVASCKLTNHTVSDFWDIVSGIQ